MFFYFLPAVTYAQVDATVIRDRGLGAVLSDCIATPADLAARITRRNVPGSGPGGESGVIVAPVPIGGQVPETFGFFPDRQKWINCGPHWLGYELGTLPGPEVLRRKSLLPGYEVPLGDGQVWQVSVIRRLGKFPALPRTMALNDTGEFVTDVLPEFAGTWDASAEMFDFLFRAESIPFEQVFALAVEALAVNYRVGPREVSVLGLLNTVNFQSVFEAACDWRQLCELLNIPDEEGQKKSAPPPVSPSTSPGPADAFPRIAQVAETST